MWIVLGVMAVLAGLVTGAVGRRGRRLDLHLLCRACGFDLFNRPEASHRCPECGADTRRTRSMRVGNRKPLTRLRATGAGLVALGASAVVMGGINWGVHKDWIGWTPMAVLRRDMVSPTAVKRKRACDEILARLRTHRGSDGEVSALMEELLRRQAGVVAAAPGSAWYRQWGDIVQAAILEGRASPAQTERYVDQTVTVVFAARPRAREGDPLPMSVTCGFRGGTDLGPLESAEVRPKLTVSTNAGGAQWEAGMERQSLDSLIPIPVTFASSITPGAAGLTAGAHLLHMECELELRSPRAGVASVTVRRAADLAVQVLAAGESSVELVDNPMAAPAMTAAMRVMMSEQWNGGRMGWLTMSDPPMPAAFRVELRAGGRSWLVGRFLARPNEYARIPLMVSGVGEKPAKGRGELLLTPDPESARGTTDIMGVWAGTVRVPVEVP